MKLLLTIIAVALPVLGLLYYIYSHDKIKPLGILFCIRCGLYNISNGRLYFPFA